MPEEPGATEEQLDMDDGMAGDEEGADREIGIPPRDQPRVPHTSEELELVYKHTLLAAVAASAMKAEDIRILDMHELVTYTDYLVICTGRSTRQTRRIGQEIAGRLKHELDLMPGHIAGETGGLNTEGGEWILMDYFDFVVHVFTPEAREFYRLDHLWKDAPAEIIE
jgi:iojap-like ribosome-associated protein